MRRRTESFVNERAQVAVNAFMDTACGAVTALCVIFIALIVVALVIPINFGYSNTLVLYISIFCIAGIYSAYLSVSEALDRYDKRYRETHAGGQST